MLEQSWSFEPSILIGVALAAGLYAAGLIRVWRQAGLGAVVSTWRAALFGLGLVAILTALVSPVASLAPLLFSMHMAQHLLLTTVAAPLLLLGAPLVPTLFGLPRPARRATGLAFTPGAPLHTFFGWLTGPLPALGLHTLTIWAWHLPVLYEAGLRSDAIHHLQHALFLGTALIFWWPVIQPMPGRRGMSYGLSMLYLAAATIAQMKVLGGLLTFSSAPIYRHYAEVPRIWDLSALADQQIAGIMMLVGGFALLGIAFTLVFFIWAAHEGRDGKPASASPTGGVQR